MSINSKLSCLIFSEGGASTGSFSFSPSFSCSSRASLDSASSLLWFLGGEAAHTLGLFWMSSYCSKVFTNVSKRLMVWVWMDWIILDSFQFLINRFFLSQYLYSSLIVTSILIIFGVLGFW